MSTPLTIATNNPFALIQKPADAWVGLTGSKPNGFLIFDTATNGARAGWINLYNAYLSKGINTPNTIIPIYAPDGGGRDGAYSKFIAQRLNITTDTPIITAKQIWELGRAIIRFESGVENSIPDAQLLEGYKLAQQRVKLPDLNRQGTVGPVPGDTDEKKKKRTIILLSLTGLALFGLLLWTKNKR